MKIKKILVLTISSFLMLSSVAFASPVSHSSTIENAISVTSITNKMTPDGKQKYCHKHRHKMGMITTLKDKFKISEAQFESARTSGKSIFELAKANGYTEEQVRSGLLAEKYKHLDEAVSKGKMDKAKSEAIKAKMKIKMASWDGKVRDKNISTVPKEKISN